MHFRTPHRNLAITMLLTSGVTTGSNDEHPDTDRDAAATPGGGGFQAEEDDDIDGAPSSAH